MFYERRLDNRKKRAWSQFLEHGPVPVILPGENDALD
jgi:hypothetical protein